MAKEFRFDDFVLDCDAFELHRGSALVAVEPLVLDLMVLLLEQPGVVVSRDALMEQVWKGRIVSDTSISTAIKSARKAVGDTGRDQKYIRTVRGRGIQWVAPFEHEKEEMAPLEPLSADAALTETRNGLQIWAQRFETINGPGAQEILMHEVIRRIEPRLMQAMVADMQLPGAALMMKQDYKAAAGLLAEGMACSPADSRLSVWGTALALAQLAQGELDGALESAANACQEDDRLYLPRLALAGVHLVRKEQAEALSSVRETLRTKPDLNQTETVCVLGKRLGAAIWSMAEGLAGAAH